MLDLQDNGLGDTEAQSLAEALKRNSTITSIILNNNDIGTAGAQSLAEALKINSTVIALYIEQNDIKELGGEALIGSLNANRIIFSDIAKINLLSLNNQKHILTILDDLLLKSADKAIYSDRKYAEIYAVLFPHYALTRYLTRAYQKYNELRPQIDKIYTQSKEGFERHRQDIIAMCAFNTNGLTDAANSVIFEQSLSKRQIADISIDNVEEYLKELQDMYNQAEKNNIRLTYLEKEISEQGIGATSLLIKYFRSTDESVRKIWVTVFASVDAKYMDMFDKLKYYVSDKVSDAESYVQEMKEQVSKRRDSIKNPISNKNVLHSDDYQAKTSIEK